MDLDAILEQRGEELGKTTPPSVSRASYTPYTPSKPEPVICTPLPDPVKILSWDTETYKITEKTGPCPPLVCVQTQYLELVGDAWQESPPMIWGADHESKEQGVEFIFHVILHRPDITLVSLNGFFDFAVLLQHRGWPLHLVRAVFKAFAEGRIRDCIARAKEHAVEFGWLEYDPSLGVRPRFNMEQLSQKYLMEEVKGKHGEDSFRLRYGELDGQSWRVWPDEAQRYAIMDPVLTQRIWRALCIASTPPPDECMQTESAWQLHLASVNGIFVDHERVRVLRSKIIPIIKEGVEKLSQTTAEVQIKDKKNGTLITATLPAYTPGKPTLNKKAFRELVDAAFGGHASRTAKGEVQLTEKQLRAAFNLTGNPLFDPKRVKDRLQLAMQWDQDHLDDEDLDGDEEEVEEEGEESASPRLVVYSKPKKTMKVIYDIVERHFRERGLPIPLTKPKKKTDPLTGADITPTPRTATSRDIIEQVPLLKPLADIGAAQKVESMYLLPRKGRPALFDMPTAHANWNHMVASGRVSVSNPNLNNIPRMTGVRECFRARPGYLLISADYAQAELCSLAQVCIDKFGHSRMAELINEGLDLHLYLVGKLRGQDYDWLVANKKLPDVKNDRQGAKAANFGFPGGLGIDKFIKYAADTFGIMDMTREEAEEWKDIWKSEYPEMPVYQRWISNKVKNSPNEFFTAVQHRSGRRRGRVGYTDGCNTYFQGLTADGAKYAMNMIGREAWCEPDSPIYGFRLVAFIYDEIFGEMPDRGWVANTRAALRLCQIMKEAMELFTPDVVAKVEPAYQYNWSKGADPVWGEFEGQKVLLPWEHRGGKFVLGEQIVSQDIVWNLTDLTTWDKRQEGKLVRLEDVPEPIRASLLAA